MAIDDKKTLSTAGSMYVQGGGTGASTRSLASSTTNNPRGNPSRRVLSAGTLAGDRVRNSAGDDLGKIEEIMLDLQSGRVAYAVLSFGGFLGIGDKLFAVPWESLQLVADEHEFILDVDKQTLDNAPGFDKDNWPNMADTSWGSQVHSHYGREPYWNNSQAAIEDELGDTGSQSTRAFSAGAEERGNC